MLSKHVAVRASSGRATLRGRLQSFDWLHSGVLELYLLARKLQLIASTVSVLIN